MRTGKQHLFRLMVVAGAALAAAVPTAQAAGPDDRPLYRGSSAALSAVRSTPDDRAYYRGTSAALAPKSVGPDDRAYARSTTDIEPGTISAMIAVSSSGFEWDDALIGGTFGFALALLGAGAIVVAIRHRRGVLRTA